MNKIVNKSNDLFNSGDIISYLDMCRAEGVNLQRGMNYRLKGSNTVILMSVRPGAPYNDEVLEDGKILIYEGHDEPNRRNGPDPKKVDQPESNPGGSPTQNKLFSDSAHRFKSGSDSAELVRVYEKLRSGIWVYNGLFELVDAWKETSGNRNVFKFKLRATDESTDPTQTISELHHTRMIPSHVKLEVWKRDKGVCTQCGSADNLHYDHIIPFSKGGSSLTADNIQLLCARHNLNKRNKIQ
jgi:hypothetical protein